MADWPLARIWRLWLSVLEIECKLRLPRILHSYLLKFPKASPCPGPPLIPDSRDRSGAGHAPTTGAVIGCCTRSTRPSADNGSSSLGARPARGVMNHHTQHVLSAIANEVETRQVISLVSGHDNPDLSRHMELHHSNCGDAATLAMVFSDSATTIPKRSFAMGIIRRPCNSGVGVVDAQAATRSRPARAAAMSRRARWTSSGTKCWVERALSRHALACGTALWLRFGSCLPG